MVTELMEMQRDEMGDSEYDYAGAMGFPPHGIAGDGDFLGGGDLTSSLSAGCGGEFSVADADGVTFEGDVDLGGDMEMDMDCLDGMEGGDFEFDIGGLFD